MRRTRTTIAALAATLALVACGDEPASSVAPVATATAPAATTTTATSTTTTTTTAEPGIDPLTGASTDPAHADATNEQTALLTAVRAARHEGYDRVVFEFRNALPGYDVRYVEPPVHADGSGDVVDVDGAFVLQVRMENALDADLGDPAAPMTYTGPQRFSPGTPEIAELVRTGGFEGVLTWVAGVRDRVDFRVTTLDGPPRLVVDLRNH
jgi:hypothetical protein